jgi:prepilin-type N-terminal cleavage/methylation domain-containing protein
MGLKTLVLSAITMRTQFPTNRSLFPSRQGARSFARDQQVPARAGFTIMELAVVLLVMGIVAAAAVPSYYVSLQFHELETAARRVVLDLEQVRHVARSRSETQTLTFDSDTVYTLSSGIKSLKSAGEVYRVDLAGPPIPDR